MSRASTHYYSSKLPLLHLAFIKRLEFLLELYILLEILFNDQVSPSINIVQGTIGENFDIFCLK